MALRVLRDRPFEMRNDPAGLSGPGSLEPVAELGRQHLGGEVLGVEARSPAAACRRPSARPGSRNGTGRRARRRRSRPRSGSRARPWRSR
ncbi:MAG: hypothetical protein MZV64_50095 [Ignavibacteriales bacterium]|nr:hypothetical protein [Ignavibacteriales bacterium]